MPACKQKYGTLTGLTTPDLSERSDSSVPGFCPYGGGSQVAGMKFVLGTT